MHDTQTHFRHNRRAIKWTFILHAREMNFPEWLPFQFMLGIFFFFYAVELFVIINVCIITIIIIDLVTIIQEEQLL